MTRKNGKGITSIWRRKIWNITGNQDLQNIKYLEKEEQDLEVKNITAQKAINS